MSWSSALPNLLIGLREGLEAGLIVTILLAALRRQVPGEPRPSPLPIWLGVLGAVSVAGSVAAILTFSTSVLSSRGQEAVGGVLSVLAVGLVTAMVFWMRRAAAGLSAHLRGEVAHAAAIGGGALAVTAFLAVGREGLETTLFLWTAVRASGHTVAPLVGAFCGLAAAVALCWLLFRRAIRLDLGKFFSRTAFLLIVIAAGVLAYGLGDLQDAGLLAGQRWVAFDLTAHVDVGSWWVALITGVTELSARMTVLQVVAWLTYLAVVVPSFILAARHARPAVPAGTQARIGRWEQLAGRRPVVTGSGLVVVPALVAAITIAALPAANATNATTLHVTRTACGSDWSGGYAGEQTFNVVNDSGRAGEVNLDDAGGAVVAELETLGPGTTASMDVTLSAGSYTLKCLLSGQRRHPRNRFR